MKRVAIITGCRGQDGSILSEQLLGKGYKVYGLIRRSSSADLGCSKGLEQDPNFEVVEGDLLDLPSLTSLCKKARADIFINAAAQSVHPNSLLNIKRDGGAPQFRKIEKLWNRLAPRHTVRRELSNDGLEVEVIDLPTNLQLNVLAYKSGMANYFPIRQISRHKYKGKLIHLKQKWGEVVVTPNHSVYRSDGQLVRPTENPELLAARKVNYYNTRPRTEVRLDVSETRVGSTIEIDELGWSYCEGQEDKRFRLSLNEKDGSLSAFLRFCGAFIAEGWTSFNKANGAYITGICQNDRSWLDELGKDLQRFYSGPFNIVEGRKNGYASTWQLQINSRVLYNLMRKYCGIGSNEKKIPSFVFLLRKELWGLLLGKMLEGDGRLIQCKDYANNSYTSTSEVLIAQLGYMWSCLGLDYSYSRYAFENASWSDRLEIRETKFYKTAREETDLYEELDYDGYVYDISVDEVHNFCIGLGNVVVHNSHVGSSFEQPIYTFQATGQGVLHCLEAIRQSGIYTKFVQLSTSEMFGGISGEPATEQTEFHPRSPYGVAKLAGYWITINYRESYKMFAANSICFNHEYQGRRGPNFVTRKITLGIASIKNGKQTKLALGNLDAKRDWMSAWDACDGIIRIAEATWPSDYVLASGSTHSVREFCDIAFTHAELGDYKQYVEVDPRFFRPAEVNILLGDSSKIEKELGWKATTTFDKLVRDMVDWDLKNFKG